MKLIPIEVGNDKRILPMDEGLYTQLTTKVIPKVQKKDYDYTFCVDGEEGCLSGDTEIQISRCKLSRKYTLKRLYNAYNNNVLELKHYKQWDLNIPSFVRSYNGKDIRLHKIHNVKYSGYKRLYKLTLENGYTIKATQDHKIMTSNGFIPLCKLSIENDLVMYDTLKSERNGRIKVKLYDIALRTKYHPYSKHNRVEVHRLIYEARLNKMTFIEYLDILLNDREKSKNLRYVDINKHHIHHKDGFHYNNSIDNLELINKNEHLKIHGPNNYQNFSQGIPKYSKIKNITNFGEDDVYDIICEEPYHNFVANGIVVHNSGKSVFAMQIAKVLDPNFSVDNIAFTPTEFVKKIVNSKKHQCIVFDEAFTGLSSRSSLSEVNQLMVSLMMEMRQRNLFVIIVLPTIFLLERYVVLHRSKCLFHVYINKKGERGNWIFFNRNRMKLIYISGKKFYSYSAAKAQIWGEFKDIYTVDERTYRENKWRALQGKDRNNKRDRYKTQRDRMIHLMYTEKIYNQVEMSKMFKKYKIDLSRSSIKDVINSINNPSPITEYYDARPVQ